MKYELKIEFQDEKQLENVIQSSYFEDGQLGKIGRAHVWTPVTL